MKHYVYHQVMLIYEFSHVSFKANILENGLKSFSKSCFIGKFKLLSVKILANVLETIPSLIVLSR